MPNQRITFRCDASSQIGGGHVVRCMALATAFRSAGAAVRFCVSDATPETVRELTAEFPDTVTGFTANISEVERLRGGPRAETDVLVIDHYGIGFDYEAAARGYTRSLLVIDDYPTRRHAATHLVDTTHGRRPEEYSPVVDKGTVLMCGSTYAMLRPAFRARRPAAATGPADSGRLSVLATFGMTDPANISGMAAAALTDLAERVAVTFVLGGKAPHLDELGEVLSAAGRGWRLVLDANAEHMASLTAEADLVIGAPGGASYERCCLGKPTLLVQFADNQAGYAAALVEAGAARLIGVVPRVGSADIRNAVADLLAAPQDIRKMSAAALGITDGKGVWRIVAAVLDRDAG